SSTGSRSSIDARREASAVRSLFLFSTLTWVFVLSGLAEVSDKEEAADFASAAALFLPRMWMGVRGIPDITHKSRRELHFVVGQPRGILVEYVDRALDSEMSVVGIEFSKVFVVQHNPKELRTLR